MLVVTRRLVQKRQLKNGSDIFQKWIFTTEKQQAVSLNLLQVFDAAAFSLKAEDQRALRCQTVY